MVNSFEHNWVSASGSVLLFPRPLQYKTDKTRNLSHGMEENVVPTGKKVPAVCNSSVKGNNPTRQGFLTPQNRPGVG
jgi:hypothetical protein